MQAASGILPKSWKRTLAKALNSFICILIEECEVSATDEANLLKAVQREMYTNSRQLVSHRLMLTQLRLKR
jgi:hypothetical protein